MMYATFGYQSNMLKNLLASNYLCHMYRVNEEDGAYSYQLSKLKIRQSFGNSILGKTNIL